MDWMTLFFGAVIGASLAIILIAVLSTGGSMGEDVDRMFDEAEREARREVSEFYGDCMESPDGEDIFVEAAQSKRSHVQG